MPQKEYLAAPINKPLRDQLEAHGLPKDRFVMVSVSVYDLVGVGEDFRLSSFFCTDEEIAQLRELVAKAKARVG